MRTILLYNPKASETKDTLISVAKEKFNIELIPCNSVDKLYSLGYTYEFPKIIKYGLDDGFSLSKDEQLELFADIIPNTMPAEDGDIDDYDTVVVKMPITTIMLGKDYLSLDNDYPVYKYIPNKTEWRINYSFGVVNSIYNKNLLPNTVFGKADITQWSYEEDKKIRGKLIKYTKDIAQRLVDEGFTDIKHFGLDIIRDNDTGIFYLLELNKAHSLNAENCEFFIKGWLRSENILLPKSEEKATLSSEDRELLTRLLRKLGMGE